MIYAKSDKCATKLQYIIVNALGGMTFNNLFIYLHVFASGALARSLVAMPKYIALDIFSLITICRFLADCGFANGFSVFRCENW